MEQDDRLLQVFRFGGKLVARHNSHVLICCSRKLGSIGGLQSCQLRMADKAPLVSRPDLSVGLARLVADDLLKVTALLLLQVACNTLRPRQRLLNLLLLQLCHSRRRRNGRRRGRRHERRRAGHGDELGDLRDHVVQVLRGSLQQQQEAAEESG